MNENIHDFVPRGTSSEESAAIAGAAHLLPEDRTFPMTLEEQVQESFEGRR